LSVEPLEERWLLNATVISGYVFNDVNNNGLFDTGEAPIANSTIQLRNSSGTVIGTVLTDATGYYNFSTDSTINTNPTTLTRTASVPDSPTDWTQTVSIAQFNPSLGQLTSIDVINADTFTSHIRVESLDSAPSTITATVSGALTLSGPAVASLLTNSSASQTFQATAFDGTIDFGGTSGHDFGSQTAPGSNQITLTNATDLAQFLGTGSVSFTEVTRATSSASGAGNLLTQINSSASAHLSVVYHYIPSNAIRPGNYTILQVTGPAGYLNGKVSSNGNIIPSGLTSRIIPITVTGPNLPNNDFGELKPSTIGGYVYVDANNNGIKDNGEVGIGGVIVTLTGQNDLGTAISLSQTTAADGSYQFASLRPGTYTVTEAQPTAYLDGKDALGSLGGQLSNDQIGGIALSQGSSGVNYNFGELTPATVAGYVYMDANNNGAKDPGELGIPGATLALTGTNDLGNSVSQTQTTAADGSYQFKNLRPGTYMVTESQPAGYLDGKDAVGSVGGTLGSDTISAIVLGVGTNGANYNFGELAPSTVSGFVYYDGNDNGVKDPGEPGIAGYTVTLTGTNDLGAAVNQTQTTATDGSYRFTNLRPGTYTVTETPVSAYLDAADNLGSLGGVVAHDQFSGIGVAVGVTGTNYNFGEVLPNSISGYMYLDVNNDGIKEAGDTGIAGGAIVLTGTNDLGAAVNLKVNTGLDGSYRFTGLRPGTYTLSATHPASFLDGKDAVGTLGGQARVNQITGVVLTTDAVGSNYNFAALLPGALSGYVYVDTNDNGIKDAGEAGIGGVTVTLSGTDDLGHSFSLSQTTAADGSYKFAGLRPGVYALTETAPSGYLDGKDSVGSLGGLTGNDQFSSIATAVGTAGVNYNFGEVLPGSLSGFVFLDSNENCVKDSGEPGIGGVAITLTGTDDRGGTVSLSQTTAADGSYQFTGLRPGSYTISETTPGGFLDAKNMAGSLGGAVGHDQFTGVVVTPGVAGVNYDFCEVQAGRLSGFVYLDGNNDGVKEYNESGIAGVTVTLTGTTDLGATVSQSTITGADGSYAFQGLRPGTYSITETQPAQYVKGKLAVGSLGGSATGDLFSGIALGSGANGVNYDFGQVLPPTPIGLVYADSFTPTPLSFGNPLSPDILSKLELLSNSPGDPDPTVVTEAYFVNGLYRTILGRDAEESAITYWVQQLQTGVPRGVVVQTIWTSAEHYGIDVNQLYVTFLHRNADPAGLQVWVSNLQAGMTEEQVAQALIASSEFQAEYASDTAYIMALYADILGRTPSVGEVSNWQQALQGGLTRDQVAHAFLFSGEASKRMVDDYYLMFLGRPADSGGEQYWVNLLTSGQATPTTMGIAFLASGEFYADAQAAANV
jgi:protocatechuate 3,4-dioxygenase beta subunit